MLRPDINPAILQLFRCLVRGEPYLGDDSSWKFWDKCHRHGLTVPLAYHLEKHGHPDPEFRARVNSKWKDEFGHFARYQCFLEAFHEKLAAANCPVLLLKGAGAWFSIYAQNPSLRHISDVDIFVPTAGCQKVREILFEMNFFCNEHAVFSRPDRIQVDAHLGRLGASEEACGLGPGFWESSQPTQRFPFFRILAPAEELTYIAIHALKHSYLRLLWLLDLYHLKQQHPTARVTNPVAAQAIECADYLLERLGGNEPVAQKAVVSGLVFRMVTEDLHPLGQLLLCLFQPSWILKVRALWAISTSRFSWKETFRRSGAVLRLASSVAFRGSERRRTDLEGL